MSIKFNLGMRKVNVGLIKGLVYRSVGFSLVGTYTLLNFPDKTLSWTKCTFISMCFVH